MFQGLYEKRGLQMLNQLSDEYLPTEILHRKEQIDEISECFDIFNKGKYGSQSLAILGVTGSGKSTIIRKIEEEKKNAIYINCAETKTAFKTLKAICGAKVKTHSDMLSKIIEFLKENPKIIILDEADKVTDLIILMNDLNVVYRKLMIPVILVTLKRDIVETLPSDVRKTFFFQKVNLPSYNAFELKDILISRLKIADIEVPELDEGKIAYIAAIAAQQGSARVLINITLRCLQRANFSEEYIGVVYDQITKEDWLDFVNGINHTEKVFLLFLLDNCDWEKEISSEYIQNNITFPHGKKLSGGRISQLLNSFEKYSLISSRHNNQGRAGGRKRMVKFCTKENYQDLSKELGY